MQVKYVKSIDVPSGFYCDGCNHLLTEYDGPAPKNFHCVEFEHETELTQTASGKALKLEQCLDCTYIALKRERDKQDQEGK